MKVQRISIGSETGTKNISISAVIPTIKERIMALGSLKRASESLSLNLEVIVVTDRGPRLEHRARRARMRNVGAHMATGEILVFVDDDVTFQPSDLRKSVDILIPGRGLITGGVYVEPWACLPMIGTRFLALKKVDFDSIGGFNERLCAYEDWEFTLRALSKGYRLVSCAPRVEHTHVRTFRELLFRDLVREMYGTLAIVMHAKFLRERMLRWFFPFFIYRPALTNNLWRNGITRAVVRMISFYYLTVEKALQLVTDRFLRRRRPLQTLGSDRS